MESDKERRWGWRRQRPGFCFQEANLPLDQISLLRRGWGEVAEGLANLFHEIVVPDMNNLHLHTASINHKDS